MKNVLGYGPSLSDPAEILGYGPSLSDPAEILGYGPSLSDPAEILGYGADLETDLAEVLGYGADLETDLAEVLGDLGFPEIVGATYSDYDTLLSVQKQIQKLATLNPAYAACPTNKKGNTRIGPKFAAALTAFNKQFGKASDGATITDDTLAALKSDAVKNAAAGVGAPPVSADAQALIDLDKAQDEQRKAAEAKASAKTPEEQAKAQAAAVAADAKVKAAADKVVATTDDPDTKKNAEEAKQSSTAVVVAKTPEEAKAAEKRTEEAQRKVDGDVKATPGAEVPWYNTQVGPMPAWGWMAVGGGTIALVTVLGLALRRR